MDKNQIAPTDRDPPPAGQQINMNVNIPVRTRANLAKVAPDTSPGLNELSSIVKHEIAQDSLSLPMNTSHESLDNLGAPAKINRDLHTKSMDLYGDKGDGDAASESSYQTLNSEEKAKLKKVLKSLLGAVGDQDEKDEIQAIKEEEWIDPTPDLIEGIFYVPQTNIFVRCCTKRRSSKQDKTFVYDYRSLYCLHYKNTVRIELVNFACSNLFENFIILLIFFNSIILAIYDYDDRDNLTDWNQRLEKIGSVFTILFAMEMTLKILAQGFIIHTNAYLRDAWNWLDFVVVVTGIMEMMELSWFKVRALRTLRVLRPLRSIKAFPKMRQLVSSLVGSVNSLLNAVVFMLFIFMLFGILGIQQFQGSMYRRCRYTPEPLEDGTWPFDPEIDHLCSPDGQGLMECPVGLFCREPADAGLPADIDAPFEQSLIFYNVMGFDNLAWAMLTIFQMITLEQWTTVMYNLMDSNIWWMGVIFCVLLVLIGSFFLLNVILAVLADALNMVDQVQFRQDKARLLKIQRSLDRAKAQDIKNGIVDNTKPVTESSNQPNSEVNVHVESQGQELLGRDHTADNVDEFANLNEKTDKNVTATNFDQQNDLTNKENQQIPIEQMSPIRKANDLLPRVTASEQKPETKGLQLYETDIAVDIDPDRIDEDQNRSDNGPIPNKSATNVDKPGSSMMFLDKSFAESQKSEMMVSVISVAPERVKKSKIFLFCYRVCTHWTFTMFITILIVANTFTLALDSYPEDKSTIEVTELLDKFFTWAFIFEMVIKLIGLGFREYTRDSFNIFDAIIVVLSIVDLILSVSLSSDSPTGALSAFRGVRLLRVFKLARSWDSFREILAKIIVTLKDISTFSVLLLMFMFIFTLLGMELFGYKVQFDEDTPVPAGTGLSPRPNFDNIWMGFTSIFAIAIGDDWNYLMALAYRTEGFIALAFYPVVFILMNLILLNLFLAILLQNFETKEEEPEVKDQTAEQEDKAMSKIQRRCKRKCKPCQTWWLRACSCCYLKEKASADDQEEDDDSIDEYAFGVSLSSEIPLPKAIEVENDGQVVMHQEIQDGSESDDSVSNKVNEPFPIIHEAEAVEENEDGDVQVQAKNQLSIQKAKRKTVDSSKMRQHFNANRVKSSNDIVQMKLRLQESNLDLFADDKDQGKNSEHDSNNRPGNDQDGSNQNQDTEKKVDPNVETFTKTVSPKIKNSKKLKRSATISTRNQISNMQSIIQGQYNPENLKSAMTKNKSIRNAGDKKKLQAELKETEIMLINQNKNMSLAQLKKLELIEKFGSVGKNIQLVGRTLFIFSPSNCIRRVCYHVVKHGWYDSFVLLLIAISTILLTLDNPNMDPEGDTADVLGYFDYVLTTLFTLECTINIILFGLYCNGQQSYARDPWNVMDLIIVFFSLFTIVLASQGGGADLSILKVFRMLRVLRPLRFLKRNLGLKIQVVSLMNAIPGIGNLLLISLLILMIFGIQAVGLLKGTFYYCETTNVPDYAIAEIQTKWDCLDYGGEWINQEGNFDNVVNAMITMFGMMSTEGWLEVMWSAVDSTNIHQVPRRNNKLVFIFFFSFFMVCGSLFVLNLFVGVVINTFNIEKEKLSHNNLLTDLQNEWTEVLIKCYQIKPVKDVIETGNRVRDKFASIARHNVFEVFIFGCICVNTVVLALSWYGMNEDIIGVLEILNYIFTVIYTFEMIIKMIGFGKSYFEDGWCVFDFLIVMSAWAGIILLQVFNIDVGSISTIIRSFRIARVLKLIKTAKNLQQIFQTFVLAIPELMNVGALLMLFLFLFAVLGVSLFAEVKPQDDMNRHAGFDTFGRAILTLLRVSTGEGWVGIMYDAARSESILFSCVEKQTYEEKMRDGLQGCGNSASYFFFVAFILIVSLVFLNLFIAIILEGFAASATEQNIRVGEQCLDTFTKVWKKYDPQATGLVNIEELEPIIMDLIQEEVEFKRKNLNQANVGFNLYRFKVLTLYMKWKRGMLEQEDKDGYFKEIERNVRRQRGLRREMLNFIKNLQIPLYAGLKKIQFHDTLNGIVHQVYNHMHEKMVTDRAEAIETKKAIGEKLKGLEGLTPGSVEFWSMSPSEQEELLELCEKDFQKVINRLEGKGMHKDFQIMKLNFMRRLRTNAGKKHGHLLDMFEGHVYDSSHIIGAQIISKHLSEKLKRKRLRELGFQENQSPRKDSARFIAINNSHRSLSGKDNLASPKQETVGMLIASSDKSIGVYSKEEQAAFAVVQSLNQLDIDSFGNRNGKAENLRTVDVSAMKDETHSMLGIDQTMNMLVDSSNNNKTLEAQVNHVIDPLTYDEQTVRENEHETIVVQKSVDRYKETKRPQQVSDEHQFAQIRKAKKQENNSFQKTIEEAENEIRLSQDLSTNSLMKTAHEQQTFEPIKAKTIQKLDQKPLVEEAEKEIRLSKDHQKKVIATKTAKQDQAKVISVKKTIEQPEQKPSPITFVKKDEVVTKNKTSKDYFNENPNVNDIRPQQSPSPNLTKVNLHGFGAAATAQLQSNDQSEMILVAHEDGLALDGEEVPSTLDIKALKYKQATRTSLEKKTGIATQQRTSLVSSISMKPNAQVEQKVAPKTEKIRQEKPYLNLENKTGNFGLRSNSDEAQSYQQKNMTSEPDLVMASSTVRKGQADTLEVQKIDSEGKVVPKANQMQSVNPSQTNSLIQIGNSYALRSENNVNFFKQDQANVLIKQAFEVGKIDERSNMSASMGSISQKTFIKSGERALKSFTVNQQPITEPSLQFNAKPATVIEPRTHQFYAPMNRDIPTSEKLLASSNFTPANVYPSHQQLRQPSDDDEQQQTLQPELAMGRLMSESKRSGFHQERFFQPGNNNAMFFMQAKTPQRQTAEGQGRKLRKDSTNNETAGLRRQRTVGKQSNQGTSARSIGKTFQKQKQQMTVFQNSSKKPAAQQTKTNKQDMIWFSGSQEDIGDGRPKPVAAKTKKAVIVNYDEPISRARHTHQGFARNLQTIPSRSQPMRKSHDKSLNQPQEKYSKAFNQQLQVLNGSMISERNLIVPLDHERTKFIEGGKRKTSVEDQLYKPKVSDLIDYKGQFSAFKFSQLEPNGHALQPQPFMAGISELKDTILNESPGRSRPNNKTLQKQLIEQNLKGMEAQNLFVGTNLDYNTKQSSVGSKKYRSQSRSGNRQPSKKKMLLDAYNLI